MKLLIGSDHAGYELKEYLKHNLAEIEWQDCGTYTTDSVDYPDYAHDVADKISHNPSIKGILICGSANGVSISANRHHGVRAAIAWNTELAKLAREHNDANILSLPARFISKEEALSIVETFLNTVYEGGRHQKRVAKIELP